MEKILEEIGVVQDEEENVLEKYLKSKGVKTSSGTTTSKEPRVLTTSTVAQSIIENDQQNQFQNMSNDELMKELDVLRAQEKNKKLRKRPAAKLLEKLPEPVEEPLSKKRKSVHQLNNLLLEAAETNSSNRRAPKVNEKFRSFQCPVCEQEYEFRSDVFETLSSNHVDRCLRQSSKRTSLKAARARTKEVVHDLLLDTDEEQLSEKEGIVDDDDDEEASFQAEEKNSDEVAITDEDDYENNNNIDDIDEERLLVSSENIIGDDWEEEHFHERLHRLELHRQDKGTHELIDTPFNTQVIRYAWEKLYEYQKEGCRWLYSLYNDGVGGILADEMGLGKTAQMATHLSSLGIAARKPQLQGIFLVVCPATVLQHWLKEMHFWAPYMRTGVLHSISSTGKALCSLSGKGTFLLL
jgi:SNF2 family DNA or RNA helicase